MRFIVFIVACALAITAISAITTKAGGALGPSPAPKGAIH